MKVADILKVKGSAVKTVPPHETALLTSGHLRAAQIGALVVSTDGKSINGIVTERDLRLVESVSGTEPEKTLVEDAMTPDPYMVPYDTPLRDVIAAMVEHKYGCAVVMQRGHVAGIFTTIDALRALLAFEKAASRPHYTP